MGSGIGLVGAAVFSSDQRDEGGENKNGEDHRRLVILPRPLTLSESVGLLSHVALFAGTDVLFTKRPRNRSNMWSESVARRNNINLAAVPAE